MVGKGTDKPAERRMLLAVRMPSSTSHVLEEDQPTKAALCGVHPVEGWTRVWLDGPFNEQPIPLCDTCWKRWKQTRL